MKKWSDKLPLLILLVLVGYFQFYKLGNVAFRLFDEARLATNAYEMVKSGNLIVTTIGNNPDLWNTKPPMMIWAQALSIKLFGFSEFAIRLPAAICAALTTFLVFGFVSKITRSTWSGLASAIVLCTAPGYLFYHGVRNGEYDSMLTLFTTLYLVSIYLYVKTVGNKRNFWLMFFFISLICAALTKGIAAMLFTPIIFIYLLFNKQILPLLLNKYLYFGIFFFILFVLGYYEIRELESPGYLKAVADNELGGRFMAVNENHTGPWDYYWNYFKSDGFGVWYWAIPASLLAIWLYPNRKLFRAAGFFLFSAILFSVIISISQTKLFWYAIPVFPLFAITIGIFFHQISGITQTIIPLNKTLMIIILTAVFSFQPLTETYNTLRFQYDDLARDNFYAPSYYFRNAIKDHKNLNGTRYLCCGYNIQWQLYVKWLNDRGVNVIEQSCPGNYAFKAGDRLIANQQQIEEYIEKNYNYKLIDEYYGLKNYLITSVK